MAALAAGAACPVQAATLPEIRLSQTNAVPACVTPERLMAFLQRRNDHLNPRFRNIASYYKQHGEAWGVRWDYAFFQMAIETNFLTYRAPSGRMGDVDPKQNNFAGIGTTGGGVPGDSFPDVSTGVLGQIQHLVVYSGEAIANPVAQRTQLKQEHILSKSRELNRPVRFSDLARRWAADPKYGGSIEWVAERFRAESCKGGGRAPQEVEELPWQEKRSKGRTTEAPKREKVADAGSPVRTIWSRDQKQAAATADPAAARAAAKTPAAKTRDVPASPPVAVAPVTEARVSEAPVSEAPVSEPLGVDRTEPADAPEARFALFTPPAGLATAVIPRSENREPGPAKARSSEAGKTEAAAVPPVSSSPSEAVTGGPAASETPVAVSGASVGGFMIAGPSKSDFQPPSGLGVKPGRCVVETARYGGETTVLIKAPDGADVHYVALSVLDGFEDNMTKSFLASRAEGGDVIGTFLSADEALAKARTLCPSG